MHIKASFGTCLENVGVNHCVVLVSVILILIAHLMFMLPGENPSGEGYVLQLTRTLMEENGED